MLEIDPGRVGTFRLDELDAPYVELTAADPVEASARLGDTTYVFVRSYPTLGYSSILPGEARRLVAEGRRLLVIERGRRFYLYAA